MIIIGRVEVAEWYGDRHPCTILCYLIGKWKNSLRGISKALEIW